MLTRGRWRRCGAPVAHTLRLSIQATVGGSPSCPCPCPCPCASASASFASFASCARSHTSPAGALPPGSARLLASAPHHTTDVLIVGGGPSGLVLSALLSRLGVSNIVLERRAGLTTHPQAHFVGVRSLEILRGLGVFDDSSIDGDATDAIDGAGGARVLHGLDAAVRRASPPSPAPSSARHSHGQT